MLTSDRKFGVEIEFATKRTSDLLKLKNLIHIVRDGSLDAIENGAEYVSPVLCGASGAKEIDRVCELLKRHYAEASAIQTSVHVHLDGRVHGGEIKSSRKEQVDLFGKQYAISNRLKKEINQESIARLFLHNDLANSQKNNLVGCRTKIGNVTYFSKAKLEKKPMLNYTYYWIEKEDRFNWVRNMFYFYTLFSDVMEDIVSKSRRFGNMYCIPLGKSYDLDVIEGSKTMQELKNVWYKGRTPNGHRDDSRYHNVNFHCFWEPNGTVEIRSHGGTIDSSKILLWVMLHQKIADKLEKLDIKDIKFKGNLHKEFIDFVEEPLLQSYVKRLLGYYSNINIA